MAAGDYEGADDAPDPTRRSPAGPPSCCTPDELGWLREALALNAVGDGDDL